MKAFFMCMWSVLCENVLFKNWGVFTHVMKWSVDLNSMKFGCVKKDGAKTLVRIIN